MIKRKLTCFVLLILFSLSILFNVTPVQASGEAIYSIDVTVDLQADASARITQVWHTSSNQGTEFYIPQVNLGDMEVRDLQVSDENGNIFEDIGSWNVDASHAQKTGKSGLNKVSDGIEICWGKIYGEQTYTISYTLTNFIKEYSDGAFGFLARLVNDNLDPLPQKVSVTVKRDGYHFSTDNAGIWGFGFTSSIHFTDDGKVSVVNDEPFTSNHHVTVMMRLDKSLVTNATSSSLTFAELQQRAFKGSDYGNQLPPFVTTIITIVIFIAAIAFAMIVIGFAGAGGQTAPPINQKNLDYYRDIPYNGYLPAAFYTLQNYSQLKNQSTIISAYFLRWIKAGLVTIETRDKKSFLGIGGKTATSLVFSKVPFTGDGLEKQLYNIMLKAAGSDRILQENELKKWSSKNYETLANWFTKVKSNGLNYYTDNKLATAKLKPYFFNLLHRSTTEINESGIQANKNLFGFKKYLKDYTLVSERQANEVLLWDEYLVFASLFNIADEVAQEFKKLNPKFFENSMYQQNNGNGDFFMTYLFLSSLSNASYKGMQAGQFSSDGSRSGGGGGSGSFGGGGGFSGGGSGGGSR